MYIGFRPYTITGRERPTVSRSPLTTVTRVARNGEMCNIVLRVFQFTAEHELPLLLLFFGFSIPPTLASRSSTRTLRKSKHDISRVTWDIFSPHEILHSCMRPKNFSIFFSAPSSTSPNGNRCNYFYAEILLMVLNAIFMKFYSQRKVQQRFFYLASSK